MAGLQLDWYDSQAATVLPAMLASLPAGEHVAEQAMLRTWANMPMAEPGEAAALLFQAWYLQVARSVFAPILGDGLYRRLLSESYMVNKALDPLLLDDGSSPWWDGRKATLLSDALGNASRNLGSQLGKPPADWRLDDKQSVGLNHELAAAVPALATLFSAEAQPWGGTPAAVGRANYDYREPFEVDHGATVRAVGSMGAPVAMASVIPGGQSGHPLSPHYLDQFEPWRRGELLPIDATPPGRAAVTLEPLGKLAD